VKDPKTQKPSYYDPVTKKYKSADIKLLLAPKKKKKKQPQFAIPTWAEEIPGLDAQIKKIEALLKDKEELKLHEEFITNAQKEIDRMKAELKYRKALKVEADIIQEIKEAEKKKKKN